MNRRQDLGCLAIQRCSAGFFWAGVVGIFGLAALQASPCGAAPAERAEDLGKLSQKVQAVQSATDESAPVASTAPSCAPIRGDAEAARYDQVPSASIPDFKARLKLTHEILSVSGRAYDYRVLKQSELKKILAQAKKDPFQLTHPSAKTKRD